MLDHVATVSIPELKTLLDSNDTHLEYEPQVRAKTLAELQFGRRIYLRGLIEISNVCRNDCYYCGIRSGNERVTRYRLTTDEVMSTCERGYGTGLRTFVLQGGGDPYRRGECSVSLVRNIRTSYPECAITLSLGEMEHAEYEALLHAGANRYLPRHEICGKEHYESPHPNTMAQEHRSQVLRDLKQIGYQVGTGVMIGSPEQTAAHLVQDLDLIHHLQPAMIDVGSFIPHRDTPLGTYPAGNLSMILHFLVPRRPLNPWTLVPIMTAVATLHPEGRLAAIRSGCDVVMSNLSPLSHRADYALYNNKVYSGSEAVEGVALLQAQLDTIGYQIDWGRGDAPASQENKCMSYNKQSHDVCDFINHDETTDILRYARQHKDDGKVISGILRKVMEMRGLDHREVAVLLLAEDPTTRQRVSQLAEQIKLHFYGKRIVLFAPFYLSNYCISGCIYCPYHAKNRTIPHHKLTQGQIRQEVVALQDMGHKRLVLEAGEDPRNNPVEYILKSAQMIYSIHHKNGAICRVNANIAATIVEEYRMLHEAGIGTYIFSQETYHKEHHEELHPRDPKSDYAYYIESMD